MPVTHTTYIEILLMNSLKRVLSRHREKNNNRRFSNIL